MLVYGADLSLNHCGICVLNEQGIVKDYYFLTDIKKFYKADKEHGFFQAWKKEDNSDHISFNVYRINQYAMLPFFNSSILTEVAYFSIEGYAFGSITNSLCQIAELTGVIKQKLYEDGHYIRIHDPMSVKMFATGKGNASKTDMRKAAKLNEFELPDSLFKTRKTKKGVDLDGPGTDVIDAFWLAMLLHVEMGLRYGEISIDSLPPHQIQVFNRVTKAYPTNLLSRPFIHKE
jgi:hypothetical protein